MTTTIRPTPIDHARLTLPDGSGTAAQSIASAASRIANALGRGHATQALVSDCRGSLLALGDACHQLAERLAGAQVLP